MKGTPADAGGAVGAVWAQSNGTQEPSVQPPSTGDTRAEVAAAVRELQQAPDRDPDNGQFVAGNSANLRHGRRAGEDGALRRALAEPARALEAAVLGDLAIAKDGAAATTLRGLVGGYVEARLLRESLFARLIEIGGPVTTKGSKRALFDAWLSVLDRERRLALDLGLTRRARDVDPVDAVRRAVEDANREGSPGRRVRAAANPPDHDPAGAVRQAVADANGEGSS
jgi:hypothetical protein